MVKAQYDGKRAIRESVLDGLELRLIGPHRGGRVVAVAGDAARFAKQLEKHGRVKLIPLEKLDLLARGLARK